MLRSENELLKKITTYMDERFPTDKWKHVSFTYSLNMNEISYGNIILFGDFYFTLLILMERKVKIKKIFVLSEASLNVIRNNLPELASITCVISRYDLFPKIKKEKPLSEENKIRLVYGGRLGFEKNINLLLLTVYNLQKIYSLPISLTLFGEPQSFFESIGVWTPRDFDYWEKTKELLETLDWNVVPTVMDPQGVNDWLTEDKIYINLSDLNMEDFSVGAAQAQEMGIPCIVTRVGGFNDLQGDNVLKVPYHLISRNYDQSNTEELNAFSRPIAKMIHDFYCGEKSAFIEDYHFSNIPIKKTLQKKILNMKNVDRLSSSEVIDNYMTSFVTTLGRKLKQQIFFVESKSSPWFSLNIIKASNRNSFLSMQSEGMQLVMISPSEKKNKLQSDLQFKTLLITAELIIFQNLTNYNVMILKFLRETLKINTPFKIVIHEAASLLCVNWYKRDIENILVEKDIFVCFNQRDIELLKLSFKNIKNFEILIPARMPYTESIKKMNYPVNNLIYYGRISSQKNIHYLLWLIWFVCSKTNKKPKLYIIGAEDHLGAPHVGIFCKDYLQVLKTLAQDLDILENVVFRDFMTLEQIIELCEKENLTYTSMSTHSDENFGIAPWEMKINNIPTLLSDWGGYQDIERYFSKNPNSIGVYGSDLGPFIDFEELFHSYLNDDSNKLSSFLPFQVNEEFLNECDSNKPLESTKHRTQLIENFERLNISLNLSNSRYFHSYSDIILNRINAIYGQRVRSESKSFPRYDLVPWAKIENSRIIVSDPLRGRYTYEITSGAIDIVGINNSVKVSDELAATLYQLGHIHRVGN